MYIYIVNFHDNRQWYEGARAAVLNNCLGNYLKKI